MNSLAALQRRFMGSIVQRDHRVASDLRSEGGIDVALGLGIYSHAYQARLREVLGNDHGALSSYLGDVLWNELCAAYLATHPSQHRSLRQFGDALPEFLALHFTFKGHVEIAELVRFERSLLDCFDSRDVPLATWKQLQQLPAADWPSLRIEFSSSVRRLSMASNAIAIWIALKANRLPTTERVEPSEWLCWRDAELVTQFRSLDVEEAALLDFFLGGGGFSDACEYLLAWHPADDVPSRAVGHLARWAEDGLVSDWAFWR